MTQLRELGPKLVELTGGEPLLQEHVHSLIAELLELDYDVLIETSGAVDISRVDPRVHRIMDLKCPGSGEVSSNLWSNLAALTERDELKFVIADRQDYEWARETIQARLKGISTPLLLSPVHSELDPATLVAWMLEDQLGSRLNLQVHKQIWPTAKRGV